MSNIVKWSVVGVITFIVLLIAKLPATQVLSRIELPKNISLSGIDGTIWDGTVTNLIVNNIAIENVHWETSFWQLLLGKLALDLDAGNNRSAEKVSFNGNAAVYLFDPTHIQASDFNLYLPANMVIAQISLPVAVDAAGRFKVVIDELDYPTECANLQGSGQWINAGIDGLGQPLSLGNFDADLSCIEKDTLVTIKQPNRFNLSAKARVTKAMKISVDGTFKPADDLPDEVKEAAKFFGRTDAEGYYTIKL